LTHEVTQRCTKGIPPAAVEVLANPLGHSAELRLSSREIEVLRQDLARIAAERYRNEGKPSEPKRLGWKATPKVRSIRGVLEPHVDK
jgi:hypothetical protein